MSTIQADMPQASQAAPNVAVRKPPAADRRFARYLSLGDFETAAKHHLPGNASRIEPLVDRVAAADYEVFVLTVDVPVSANRENNVRAGFSIPIRPSAKLAWDVMTHPAWSLGTFARTVVQHGIPHVENM